MKPKHLDRPLVAGWLSQEMVSVIFGRSYHTNYRKLQEITEIWL